MKNLFIISALVIFFSAGCYGQISFAGKQFWAINAPDASATSGWYEEIFQLKLMKEIRFEKGHVRIIGNDELMIEIIQKSDSKELTDCALKEGEAHLMKGFFKTGFFVEDLAKVAQYLRSKNVTIKHGPFTDNDTKTKSIIIEDFNCEMIQIMENF